MVKIIKIEFILKVTFYFLLIFSCCSDNIFAVWYHVHFLRIYDFSFKINKLILLDTISVTLNLTKIQISDHYLKNVANKVT